jgi:predicted phosphodiesterase
MLIGVISDTHGLLRPEAVNALRGSDYIIHAGDIGDPGILNRLNEIAPVTAVRGNVDRERWAQTIPHNLEELDLKPEAAGFAAVIYGHSHVPKLEKKNGVLYFNPGSAGPRRFRLAVAVGKLKVLGKKLEAEIVQLEVKTT